jgi:stage V sporulation protein G
MKITDIRVRKVDRDGKLKGVASVTLDDEFVVHDLKIIEGQSGLFVAMPSRKAPDGEYRDIAHPINTATRDMFQEAILEKYNEVLTSAPAPAYGTTESTESAESAEPAEEMAEQKEATY